MKKELLTILASGLICSSLFAQTPQQKTRAVVFDFSDTWCPPCGAYGIPTADTLISKLITSDKGYLLNVKTSSTPTSLNAVGGNAMANNFDITAIPTFVVNKASVHQGTTTNIAYNVQTLEGLVSTATATSAEASAAANFSITGNKITVATKAKFWAASTGQYYMTVLLVEDDIEAQQASAATNPAIHRHVLRGSMSTATDTVLALSPWGEQLGTGTIAINTEFSKTFKVDISKADTNATWKKANLEAYVVIYKMNAGKYEVVNAEKAKTASSPTGLSTIKSVESIFVYPNPAANIATLSITAMNQQNFDIHITDMLGRTVYTCKNNKLVIGENNFTLPLNNITSGLYNVEISNNEGKMTQRLSVEK